MIADAWILKLSCGHTTRRAVHRRREWKPELRRFEKVEREAPKWVFCKECRKSDRVKAFVVHVSRTEQPLGMWGIRHNETQEWWTGGCYRDAKWSNDPRKAKLYNSGKSARNARRTALLDESKAVWIPIAVWTGSVAELLSDLITLAPHLEDRLSPLRDLALENLDAH